MKPGIPTAGHIKFFKKFLCNVSEDELKSLEIHIFQGCAKCGRRITDGRTPLPGATIICAGKDGIEIVCKHCV